MKQGVFAWWSARRALVLRLLIVVMAVAGAQRLGDAFDRLLWAPREPIDLKLRYQEEQDWLRGAPVAMRASYPPASFPMLWPLLGWPTLPVARWLWAATTLGALAWLIWLTRRESRADPGAERLAVALMPLAIYATRATIVNGQLGLHILPALIAGVLLLDRGRPSWYRDVGGAAALIAALVKPSLAIPFLALLVGIRGALRPALLVAIGYLALSLVAAGFHASHLVAMFGQWMAFAVPQAARAASETHANLHSWLAALGVRALDTPLSLALLGALTWWLYRCRDQDVWVRLGVLALVSRIWTYHARYDDVLILIPLVALFRLAKQPARQRPDMAAGLMFTLTLVTMLLPARLLFLPRPWLALVEAGQTVVWLGTLAFLGRRGWPRPASPPGGLA